MYHIVGDLNFNLVDHGNCKKVQDFLDGMIPTINTTTRLIRNAVTLIYNNLTTSFVDRTFKSGIFKSDM